MNERQKKIMVPYQEPTDTCQDCSNHPCDCGLPAGYTPTPWTDTNEEDGWNPCGWAVDSNLVRELERELAAVTEQLKAAQDGWHDEITKGLSELKRAESIYTKAQERAERAEEQRDRLAAYRDEFEDVAEIAIDILAGNHPLIDWRDAGQSELLRKLCQHLEENAPLSAMDEVREQRDEWKAKFIQQNKDLGCEMMDPNGTIWDYAKKVQTDLASMTEQRDELLRYNEEFRKETLICADCDSISKEEYDQAIEQRDRLAEAMTRIKNIYENPEKGCIPSSSDMYDEALQSLNQPTEP